MALKQTSDDAKKARKREYQRAWCRQNPEKCYGKQRAWRERNREAVLAGYAAYRSTNREALATKAWLRTSRKRAEEKGLPFELTLEGLHIPDVCPVLGIRLERGRGASTDNSPSLDRLIPELGYTLDNVRVVSQLANRIKSSATVEQLKAVVRWLEEELAP